MHRPQPILPPPRPFWGWPGWHLLGWYLLLALAQTLWFALVYGGADWLTGRRSLRVPVHLPFELGLPFVPWAAWAYMSIYGLFLIAPFVLRSRREIGALAAALAAVTGVAGLGFLLLPSELAWPEPYRGAAGASGASAAVFRAADAINLRYNLLPSLHVALSVACAGAMAPRARGAGRALLWAWAAAIALSTLLTHQHHLLDVVTGWLLGWAGARLVHHRPTGDATAVP